MVIYAYTPSTWEPEVKVAFKDILGCIRRLWLMQNKRHGQCWFYPFSNVKFRNIIFPWMFVKPNSLCSNDKLIIRKWKWYVWITCWVVFKNGYYTGAITNKDSDLPRIWDKAEKKHLKWTSLPAIPDPGNSHRAHAFCRLAFVHWCYNLQIKEKQKLTF